MLPTNISVAPNISPYLSNTAIARVASTLPGVWSERNEYIVLSVSSIFIETWSTIADVEYLMVLISIPLGLYVFLSYSIPLSSMLTFCSVNHVVPL